MGWWRSYSDWLLHEDQKEVFEAVYAGTLNLVFVLLTALALWPAGRSVLAWRLWKGYLIFWLVLLVTGVLMILAQRYFRMDMYSHYDAYVISALVVSGFLQAGWSAFVALTVKEFVAGASGWLVAGLYFVGLVGSYVGFAAVCVLYMGSIYRHVNLLLSVVSYALFCAWPAAGRAAYGWFFDLF